MSAKDLANWLSKNHCSGRYSSNGSIYWINWFVNEGYGAYPILHNSVDGTNRVSRVPVLTASGIEYVKNILEHQREHGVLAFAEVDNEVADRLLDNKIVKAFQDYRLNNLSLSDDYFISIDNLTTIVKKLIKEEA